MSIKKSIKTIYKTLVPLKPRVHIRARFDFYKYKFYHVYRVFIKYKYVEEYNTKQVLNDIKHFTLSPLISLVIPDASGTEPMKILLDSLKRQFYTHYELIVSVTPANKERLTSLFAKAGFARVTFVEQEEKELTALLKKATGDYTGIVYAKDELPRGCLYELVKKLAQVETDFIYTDDDKFIKPKKYILPNYKPDYSPITLLSQNYIANFGLFNNTFLQRLLLEETLQDCQQYDLILKAVEKTTRIVHIPEVLYHQHIPSAEAGKGINSGCRKTLERALNRRNIPAEVLETPHQGIFRIKRKTEGQPLISIITPFKDKPELLRMCLDSILSLSTYQNFEFIGISNNSSGADTFAMMKEYSEKDSRIKFYEKNIPFNFSTLNNFAAEIAKGEQLILLNNDIEIITPDWIETLLEYSQLPETGVVGAKLYYPNDEIQHAGVIVGLGGVAGHSHKMHHRRDYGFNGRLHLAQNLSAVTAACLMVKKKLYFEVGGLEEKNLSIAFNDVDFCLKLQEKGYQNVFTPYCEAYHHESISRGVEDTPEKIARFNSEMDYIKTRYRELLSKGDPYYNPNLTHFYEDFSISFSKKS